MSNKNLLRKKKSVFSKSNSGCISEKIKTKTFAKSKSGFSFGSINNTFWVMNPGDKLVGIFKTKLQAEKKFNKLVSQPNI